MYIPFSFTSNSTRDTTANPAIRAARFATDYQEHLQERGTNMR